ncbi:hypothetical protein [Reinekea sp. G2M2-21]|uniref:hypothetical protein n=1 Tax=Reinekea sp. G2M2-21 TaxID=2788942 RepID=UPI0018ABD70E|nr:hypothetical protein [Reinekea sp. G2M2-21]
MKYIGIILVSLFSTFAVASGSTASGKIEHLYLNNTWTMVSVSGISENPDSCESTAYYAIIPSDSNYSALHSTLMAAQLAGKTVKFWVNGCSGQGNKHPKIVSVWMYN